MSEYWKSTPSYWCKFCSTYVRDTGIERKNHEASGKHQGGIQRNLREIQKGKAIEDRDKQRAKDEVARLNGLVTGGGGKNGILGAAKATAAPPPVVSSAAQRKAHAEQLAALGVELPEDLKREVTGVGGWKVLSERVIEDDFARSNVKNEQEDSKEDVKPVGSIGVHKRRAEEAEEEAREEEAAAFRQRAWGTKMKSYPGAKGGEVGADLDALLSGVSKKSSAGIKQATDAAPKVKHEDSPDEQPIATVPDVDAALANVKQEAAESVPAVVFKKRKVKR